MPRPGPDFDGELLLDVARALATAAATSPDPEALHRSALNRTYYAAFVALVNRITAVCGPGCLPDEGVHATVKERLRAARVHGLGVLELQLRALEADRSWADYGPQLSAPLAHRVEDDIAKARRAIDCIKRQLTLSAVRRLC